MRFGIKTLDDLQVDGKTVLLRVDINQPVDAATGRFKDTSRIRSCAATIGELIHKRARVVVLAHQGSDRNYGDFRSTRYHAEILTGLLGREIKFIDDICGPAARQAIRELRDGEALMLDNVRYLAEEQTLFERALCLAPLQQSQTLLVRTLAPLADVYVCDAFASAHRSQPSICGFERLLPSAMGRVFEKDYCALSDLLEHPKRPCVFVMGGAKIQDSFMMMGNVLGRQVADRVLTGGLVGQILLWANDYDIGDPARMFIRGEEYEGLVDEARDLLTRYGSKIVLPVDFGYVKNGERRECLTYALPDGELVEDIGSWTAESYRNILLEAGTVFANGPMGVFENPSSELGTKLVWEAIGQSPASTLLGGIDSIAAADKYAVSDKLGHICSGGASMIRLLAGEDLPAMAALRESAALFG